jgi:1-acyl-sn-glycerol-3-phosphate acyltransferase
LSLLRSLVFYLAFYSVTVVLTLASVLAIPLGRGALRQVVSAWGMWHRWCVRWLLGIEIVVEGSVPDEPVLVAVKHESYFEAIDMPRMFRFPAVFAKRELFLIPGWGWSASIYGLIPVARDRGAQALRAMIALAKERIGEGRPLVIFPEGTRVVHGDAPPLQAGFAGIYKLLGVPVVPVAVDSGRLYHRVVKARGTITYKVGETIPPGLPREELEARVHAAINGLNTYSIECFDPSQAQRQFDLEVAVAPDHVSDTVRFIGDVSLMGKGRWPVCRLKASFAGAEYSVNASDFFDALQRIRCDFLEPRGVVPKCYGASLNVWPSGMARDMGLGLAGYLMESGKPAQEKVGIFEGGPHMKLATVAEQTVFAENWHKSLGKVG